MSDVVIDVTGISLFIDDAKVVVFIRELNGRIAMDRNTVIPPHVLLLAIPSGTYEFTGGKRPRAFTFKLREQFIGAGENNRDYDAFLLSNETVSVLSKSTEDLGTLLDTEIVRMRDVIPGKSLKKGVMEGTHSSVMGRLVTEGANAGVKFPSKLLFGKEERKSVNTIQFVFKPAEQEPVLQIAGDETFTLKLIGSGILVMAAIPIEELFGMTHMHHDQGGEKMHHFELLYDFYDLLRDDKLPIPIRKNELGPPGKCGPPAGT